MIFCFDLGCFMKIIHYALGFPPYRTGGMTKYCLDLMEEQTRAGHTVGMLWPGAIQSFHEPLKIKRHKPERLPGGSMVQNFEMINSLPIPMLDGIREIDAFMRPVEAQVLHAFLSKNEIDAIHVHTLMGFPKELIEQADKLNMKTVYTTHDYFGICPKWGLIQKGTICVDDHNCVDCIECNKTALSLKQLQFLQSPVYRKMKDLRVTQWLRMRHNNRLYAENTTATPVKAVMSDETMRQAEPYRRLRGYYLDMLTRFDVLHFNSTNTRNVFAKYFDVSPNEKIITITHRNIFDRRKIRTLNGSLRIGYLGPITEHKGFFFLKNVLDSVYARGITAFQMHLFAPYEGEADYLMKHPPYRYDELGDVMDQFDLLVVPSLWYETFGFTVLEALSYGVPVVVTDYVGAKDLIKDGKNGVVSAPTKEGLEQVLIQLIQEPQRVQLMNRYIVEHTEITTMNQHAKRIAMLYER